MDDKIAKINELNIRIVELLRSCGASELEIRKILEGMNSQIFDAVSAEFAENLSPEALNSIDSMDEKLAGYDQLAAILGLSQDDMFEVYLKKLRQYTDSFLQNSEQVRKIFAGASSLPPTSPVLNNQ